ncbi:glycosyltransferase family 2 protein [Ruegeria sp. A3M17]|uniref:glycosyltransferase family 2 protein n=1 Tax=Ruegeria sp. A3M17 TaxID=2267229 RepID=UPI000DE93A6D|nr:glycosyltransferase family 2 protein [Ruegeria sp. A3M17]RBW52517.1 glycosyltransferase family 2 protein [Ruegeria sp. A3M17]
MRLIVSIPTTNRPEIVVPTVLDIARQKRFPDLVIVVVARADDIDAHKIADLPFPVCIVQSERGSCIQRNTALSMLQEEDVLLYLDDDFLMAPDYLANLEHLFKSRTDVVMATGTVLADGIHGPGISHLRGLEMVSRTAPTITPEITDIYNCYGCNMALRAAPALLDKILFDTRLKLYAWLEDVDFSRQMAAYGRIVRSSNLRGVHLGTKVGRSSGLRVGYSQIANPLYLHRKGTMAFNRALNIMCRNLASNFVRSFNSEPEIDRLGRLKGNLHAFGDLARGRINPEKVARFE